MKTGETISVTTTSASRTGGINWLVTGGTSSTTKFDAKEYVETGNIKTTTIIESKGGLKSSITGDHTTIVTQVRDKNGNILSTEGKYERSSTLFHPSTSTTFSGTGTHKVDSFKLGPLELGTTTVTVDKNTVATTTTASLPSIGLYPRGLTPIKVYEGTTSSSISIGSATTTVPPVTPPVIPKPPEPITTTTLPRPKPTTTLPPVKPTTIPATTILPTLPPITPPVISPSPLTTCSCPQCNFYSNSNCDNACDEWEECIPSTCSARGCLPNPNCYRCEVKDCSRAQTKVLALSKVTGSRGDLSASVIFRCKQWRSGARNIVVHLKIDGNDWKECFLNEKGLVDFDWGSDCNKKMQGSCGNNKWNCFKGNCKHSSYNLWVYSDFDNNYVNITFTCKLPALSPGTHTLTVIPTVYGSVIALKPSSTTFYVIGKEENILEILLLPIRIFKRLLFSKVLLNL
jgi:hypothetical protein